MKDPLQKSCSRKKKEPSKIPTEGGDRNTQSHQLTQQGA